MSGQINSIKSLLTIKPKSRSDDYTDQYHRIFMVKMSMVASLLLGLNWVNDAITCIIPGTAGISGGYVHQACWIQGFFIYRDIKHTPGKLGYYGIPEDIDNNGLLASSGTPCTVSPHSSDCVPLEKTFYLQYQWFPFYIAVIGFLYYLPYLLFRCVNADLIALKGNLKSGGDVDVDVVVKNYFNHVINPIGKMRLRLIANIFVKLFYIIVNVIAFTGTDRLINGDFKSYGRDWVNWTKRENKEEFDYTATRRTWRPAEKLLPTFGLCEVLELGKDIKHSLFNSHRFVCEISQNVLYQYVLALLWFLFIIGMVVSVLGLLMLIGEHVTMHSVTVSSYEKADDTKKVYAALSLRECQYLECIRKKDVIVFTNVIRKLKDEILHLDGNVYLSNNISNISKKQNPYQDSQIMLQETLNVTDTLQR